MADLKEDEKKDEKVVTILQKPVLWGDKGLPFMIKSRNRSGRFR